jgi:hypothetical protein
MPRLNDLFAVELLAVDPCGEFFLDPKRQTDDVWE